MENHAVGGPLSQMIIKPKPKHYGSPSISVTYVNVVNGNLDELVWRPRHIVHVIIYLVSVYSIHFHFFYIFCSPLYMVCSG